MHRRFWHQHPYRPTSIAPTHIEEVNYFLLSLHKNQGVAELRYDIELAAGGSGSIAFKSEYLNDYLNMEWERPRI